MKYRLTLQEYNELENVVFPIVMDEGSLIKELCVACESCDGEIKNFRVKWNFVTSGCVEVRMSGKTRWYLNQNKVQEFRVDGLYDSNLTSSTFQDRLKVPYA